MSDFLYTPKASTYAGDVDALMNFINYLSIFFWVLITAAIVYFAWRYKRGHKEGVGPSHSLPLELTWSIIPLILLVAIFLWGFKSFMAISRAPGKPIEIHVTGQKWSWAFEYPEHGIRTTNELHVPVGRPVKLIMTSSDVIHSFFVPAFRNKMDVVPGRTTSMWFEATELGEHRVYCAEFCGDSHWDMKAVVVVESEEDYEKWLEESQQEDTTTPLPELGEKLFTSKACFTCHSTDGSAKVGPSLKGVFGHKVDLEGGNAVEADEGYLRESILQPNAKIVRGFVPAMPSYQGQLSEREINALVEYIKSLE